MKFTKRSIILVLIITVQRFSLCLKYFPRVTAKFPVFSLSGKSKNQIPCFPCVVATLGPVPQLSTGFVMCFGLEIKNNYKPLTASIHGFSSDKSASTSSSGYFASGWRFFNGATFDSCLVDRTVPRTCEQIKPHNHFPSQEN